MFSLMIGNPPYVNAWSMHENAQAARDFLTSAHPTFLIKHWDLASAFLSHSDICSKTHCNVLPTGLLTQPHGEPVRKIALSSGISIKNMTGIRYFKDAAVDVFLLCCGKDQITGTGKHISFDENLDEREPIPISEVFEDQGSLEYVPEPAEFATKLIQISKKLGEHMYLNYGAQVNPKKKGGTKNDFLFENEDECLNPKRYTEAKYLVKESTELQWSEEFVLDYQPGNLYGPRVTEFFENEKIVFMEISSGFPPNWFDSSGVFLNHSVVIGMPHASLPTNFRKDFGFETVELYSIKQIQFLLGNRFTQEHYLRHLKRSNHNYPAPLRQILIPSVKPEILDEIMDLNDIESSILRLNDVVLEMLNSTKN